MSLPQIRADWAQHMVYGAWVGAASAAGTLVVALALHRPEYRLAAPAAGMLGALVAGVAKEVSDWLLNRRARARMAELGLLRLSVPPHEVSPADVVATVLGAAPVVVPLFLLLWVV